MISRQGSEEGAEMIMASLPIPEEIAENIPETVSGSMVMFEIIFKEREELNAGAIRTGDYCLAINDPKAFHIRFPNICGVLRHIGKTMDTWIQGRALHYFRVIDDLPAGLAPSSYQAESCGKPETIPDTADIIQPSWMEVLS